MSGNYMVKVLVPKSFYVGMNFVSSSYGYTLQYGDDITDLKSL